MSGDDHFIKPDNDEQSTDIAHALRKLYRGHPLIEQAADAIDSLQSALADARQAFEVMHASEVLWRQTDRALRDEIKKHQTNVRQWREECGKLHAQVATAKDQRNAYQKRAQEAEKYLKVDRDSFEKIRELLVYDLEEPQRTAFWTAVGARDRIDAVLLAGVAEQSGAGAPETSVRCGAPAALPPAHHQVTKDTEASQS